MDFFYNLDGYLFLKIIPQNEVLRGFSIYSVLVWLVQNNTFFEANVRR